MRTILGLNTDHGDSSAAIVTTDGLQAAICEERITRHKHTASFPGHAISEVLRLAGCTIADVTDIAIARSPKANAAQKMRFIAEHPSSGLKMASRRLRVHRKAMDMRGRIAEALDLGPDTIRAQLHGVEHHVAHVASAFYTSPFERCAALSYDGAGDFATALWANCTDTSITPVLKAYWPHSLGVFYSAWTQFMGFDRYGEEYKVMGLAAYGENRYGSLMRDMVRFDPQHGLQLNLSYYRHHHSGVSFEELDGGEVRIPPLWGPKFATEVGPPRERGAELTAREMDLAASMQRRHEEVFLDMISHLTHATGRRDLVLAGGCALNSVANGRMVAEGYADRVYFHPAASDDGTSVGAAYHVLHNKYGAGRTPPVTSGYWGTSWTNDEIAPAVAEAGMRIRELSRDELLDTVAAALQKGRVVGWFQGREEWGPRALGNRSILCNPAFPDMKAILNSRVKNREAFRPFAPLVREEDLGTVFEGQHPVPFMIIVYMIRDEWRRRIPAVTHEDGTGRVQTVSREQNELVYDLLTRFNELTDVPVLLNTSFNENEPIVHTPEQAVACFQRTKMDCLAIGNYWLEKPAAEHNV